MNFLDRYLEAVRKHLPWQRQDDIIAELRANLESQLEEKEAGLGRPLTQAEVEAWLKQLGSPMQVAAGYQPQQYLIGPAVFPTYRYVLRVACTWAAIICAIVSVVQVFSQANPTGTALLDALLRVPYSLLMTAAWITLAFAAVEYAVARGYMCIPSMAAPPQAWSPAGLPPLAGPLPHGEKPPSFAQAVVAAVFSFLSLAWLLLIPRYPFLIAGPGIYYLQSSPYTLAPVLIQFFWCVVALNVLQLGWRMENLWRERWQQRQPILHLVFKLFGLVPLLVLVTAPNRAIVLLRHPRVRSGAARRDARCHQPQHPSRPSDCRCDCAVADRLGALLHRQGLLSQARGRHVAAALQLRLIERARYGRSSSRSPAPVRLARLLAMAISPGARKSPPPGWAATAVFT